jgi:VacB/RNase II family 3'-5' exoribonuclease
MNANDQNHRAILKSIAHRAMLERGLLPDFSAEALAELGRLQVPAVTEGESAEGDHGIRDMQNLLWASIDNDDSLDLDQLTVAEATTSGKVKILVAIADVVSSIINGSAIDQHARNNTTSVYTAAEIFPMLPEKVSTDITSLNFNEDRLSIVVEMLVGVDGSLEDSKIYRAWVRNHAKLAYNSVAAWLEKNGVIPEAIVAVQGLAENLQLQDRAAQRMKNLRLVHGALSLETIEAKPVFDGDQIRALEIEEKNRAKEIIEDFMIAANGVTARYLSAKKSPSIRRVVRTPKRWERIVEIAADHKVELQNARIPKRWRNFSSSKKPRIRCASPIYLWL